MQKFYAKLLVLVEYTKLFIILYHYFPPPESWWPIVSILSAATIHFPHAWATAASVIAVRFDSADPAQALSLLFFESSDT